MSEIIKIIQPKDKFNWNDFKELWNYRELLYFLTWRDLKVRYKQTIVGVAWVIFQPFMSMIVFTLIFGKLANIPSDGVPYPIFVFIGLLFWQFFSSALGDISNCLVNNQGIISKVYFPRVLLPLSMILTRLVDFVVASVILVALMIYYRFMPNMLIGIAIFPLLMLMTFLACLGLGLFFASLNVKYRDVRYVLPYFIQIMMFLTPVFYSTTIIGHKYSWIFALNPMSSVIKNARSAFLGVWQINWLELVLSLSVCVVTLVIGWLYFRKMERDSVDLI
jgi:lipopolysaccharide transport system permease protein